MSELIRVQTNLQGPKMESGEGDRKTLPVELATQTRLLQGMAETIRSLNDRMGRLEQMLQRQELRVPVSRAQEKAIQAAIRQRAGEWACGYIVNKDHDEAWARTEIRRSIRRLLQDSCQMSIRGMGDIPACQYETVMDLIQMWDE